MKCSPAHRTERYEFSRLSSLPWRRLPSRGSSPWIGFDPELQSDCSAAYRAFRLVMLALFALLGAGSRAQAQSSSQTESGSLDAKIEAQGRQIEQLKALVVRQAQQLQSQQQAINELRTNEHAGLTAVAPRAQSAAEDKRESAQLTVNRTHAPPQNANSFAEANPGFGAVQPHLPNQTSLSIPERDSYKAIHTADATAPADEVLVSAKHDTRGSLSDTQQPQASAESSSLPESPLQFRIGSAYITPVGFMDFTSVWRNHDSGNGIATNFASIPYGTNTFQTNLSELRFSSQYSRIGFRVDALVKGARVIGYMESDFLGNSPGNLAVSTNSNTLRSRLYWADVRKSRWELLAGQSWSLITPNRSGISPLPGDIFYTQNVDADYQAGLVYARVPELRIVYHSSEKAALAVALDSPEQYMGGSSGGGQITLPAALASVYGGGELNNGSSGLGTPNRAPDVVAKLALDPSKRLHFEAGGVLRNFRLYNPTANTHFAATGGGGFLNLRLGLTRGLSLLTNNFWSDGGGRYIFGQVPDLIVRSDGSASLIHTGSTVSGLEYSHKGSLLYGYYGGIYAQRNVTLDLGGKPIGYGYGGSPSSHNRAIQEATVGFSQSIWKNAQYGGLNLLGQYSYLTRSPWSVTPGGPLKANIHMVFLTLRYSLPGSAPTLRY